MYPLTKKLKSVRLLLLAAGILLVVACRNPASGDDPEKPADAPPDKSSLIAEIAKAQALLDSLVVSTNGADVDANKYWIISTWDLSCAIEAAQGIADKRAATVEDVQLALNELIAAYNKANSAKKLGTKPGPSNPDPDPDPNDPDDPGDDPDDPGDDPDDPGDDPDDPGDDPDSDPDPAIRYTFIEPQDETIILTASQTLSWIANDEMTVTVTGNFDTYQWYIDGTIENGATQDTITLFARDFSAGTHNVTLKVTKEGSILPYTKTLKFTVN